MIFLLVNIQNFSGRFDTSGSLIALFVFEILTSVFFVTSTNGRTEEEELSILVVGFEIYPGIYVVGVPIDISVRKSLLV